MYQIFKLPYPLSALEPFIDTHTLGLHYHKHQKTYLKKLNELLLKNNYNFELPMELLSYNLNAFSDSDKEDILFNLGGVLNHIIYFHSISANKVPLSKDLESKILTTFASLDNFKKLFKERALKVKGSGYTYLVLDKQKNLQIINVFNQDCPYFHELLPLLCIDLWEHAYYINYENKRNLYIDNFFEIIDFKFANEMYKTTIN